MRKNNLKDNFIYDLANPPNVYLLGLWWADGHVHPKKIMHSCIETDSAQLVSILKEFGVNTFYNSHPKGGKRQWIMVVNSVARSKFLMLYDYHIKSGASASKILSAIPENLHYLWWRGFFDGDGSLGLNANNGNGRSAHLNFCSVKSQNWDFFHDIIKKIGIEKYHYVPYTWAKTGYKRSIVSLHQKQDIIKFGNYIYQNYQKDKLGYKRKYNKFLELVDYYNVNFKEKSSKYKYVNFTKQGKWMAKIDRKFKRQRVSYYLGLFNTEDEAHLVVKKYLIDNPHLKSKEKEEFKNLIYV